MTASAASPLSSIFSCEAGGKKQVGGAALGGVVGGVVGNRVAKGNRTLGTALGAALGAAAGSYVGCRLQKTDQRKAEEAARVALESNRNNSWSNPETGASGSVRMVSGQAQSEPVSLKGLHLANGVEPASGYVGAAGRYQARNTANLRGSPSATAPIVGKLGAGDSVDALARVQGTNWLLAGRDGVGVGYVSDTVVRPIGGAALTGGSNCRTFDQTLKAKDGAADTQRHTACKSPTGEWVIQS
jgi:surface antigen